MTDKKKILVVDDESDVVKYLSSLLEDNGFEVITASDGAEGFASAKSAGPDLISLDITMPNETGVRLLKNLQRDERTKGIPLVVVTGVDNSFKSFLEDKQKQVAPPAAYFEKPIDKTKYIDAIKRLLSA